MSKRYVVKTTLTISGDEQDVSVRAHVEYEYGHGGWTATLDSDIEVLLADGAWIDIDSLELDVGDIARATEALETACCEDDSDGNYSRFCA